MQEYKFEVHGFPTVIQRYVNFLRENPTTFSYYGLQNNYEIDIRIPFNTMIEFMYKSTKMSMECKLHPTIVGCNTGASKYNEMNVFLFCENYNEAINIFT